MVKSLPGEAAGRMGPHGRRALVVLGESGLADILRDMLRESGFQVSRAPNAESAEARLCQESFDLVVVEHGGVAGLDAAELSLRVRRNGECCSRRAWFLVLAREVSPTELYRLRDAGVSAILTGALTVERIVARLRSMDRDRRAFIDAPGYVGPDRRFRGDFYPPEADRRGTARGAGVAASTDAD